MPGRAAISLTVVQILVVLECAEVSGSFSLLAIRGVWALPVMSVGALGSVLGFGAARLRAETDLRSYAIDQLRLAVPIYAFTILTTVLLLGPLASGEGAAAYFSDPQTYSYLLNLVVMPRYALPGVFEFNPLPFTVNQNVWIAVVFVVVMAVVGIRSRLRMVSALPAALAVILAFASLMLSALDVFDGNEDGMLHLLTQGMGLSATLGGLLGAAAFRSGRLLPFDWRIAACGGMMLAGLGFVGNAAWAKTAWFPIVCAPPVAYGTIYLSLRPSSGMWVKVARRAEPWLPGFFLLSFPLQQSAAALLADSQTTNLDLLAGSGTAAALAVSFRILIGRRLLSRRQRAVLVADETARPPLSFQDLRRPIRWRSMSTQLIVGAALVLVVLGLLAMVLTALSASPNGA